MNENLAPVDLVLVWHFHQPDYRSSRSGRSELPWARLHATKDYDDMARHLAAHRGVRATFNFVPVLVDQLEGAVRGEPDALFEQLQRPLASLTPAERSALAQRLTHAPRHALERWSAYRKLVEAARRRNPMAPPADPELLALEVWFLLAWLDPTLHGEPEAVLAIQNQGPFSVAHRDDLLGLHARITAQVLPAYRALAEAGQIELSTTPYYHPILPLLIDLQSARRARPDLPLPNEPFAAPDDARAHLSRALARHAEVFGRPARGIWPAEGSVSPETAEMAAAAGLLWMASDEHVLWASLPERERRREALYRPWTFDTPAGPIAMLFRDHELSDRIGFVYQRWEARDAAEDFVQRLRRIARELPSEVPPVVAVILDGENCWEGYADDGLAFLDALYQRLADSPDVRTRTPAEVVADHPRPGRLGHLHSGSWIDADFHIWVGHPEKNRAWELLSRTRRNLIQAGTSSITHPRAWDELFKAEGSDWFWWFGDDHPTLDRDIFDRLFRECLRAAYEAAGVAAPAVLEIPIAARRDPRRHARPIGFVHPVLDGRRTHFYEWQAGGRFPIAAGGSSMHRAAGLARDLYYGFDLERFYLRIDFPVPRSLDGLGLRLEIAEPRAMRLEIHSLAPGEPPVRVAREEGGDGAFDGARCVIGSILELSLPFRALGLAPGERVEMLIQAVRDGQPIESLPPDDVIRFVVPDESFEAAMWSA